jgi:hypothetical protein
MRLSDLLHDAVFRAAEVNWNHVEREVGMRFWREADELPSSPLSSLLPFVRARRFRRVECIVVWRSVHELVCSERDHLDYHCITGVRVSVTGKRQKIEFVTEGAMELYVLADEINGEYRDTGRVTEDQFGFRTLTLRWRPNTEAHSTD